MVDDCLDTIFSRVLVDRTGMPQEKRGSGKGAVWEDIVQRFQGLENFSLSAARKMHDEISLQS